MIITSTSNERIKDIKKIIKSSKERYERGLFVVEGIRMFKEIPAERIDSIYVSESGWDKYSDIINEYNLEPNIVSDKIFAGISDTSTPQGILSLVRMYTYALEDVMGENSFIIIGEKIQDPGNLGTIIRTAEGAGVTGIVLSDDSVDIYNPKVVRSTMGSIFRLPIYISHNLNSDIDLLKEKQIVIYGAHLDGEDFYKCDFKGSCGFLVGNEGNGLSKDIALKADKLVKIPMNGKVESLNVAISTAVISYEVLRQRIML